MESYKAGNTDYEWTFKIVNQIFKAYQDMISNMRLFNLLNMKDYLIFNDRAIKLQIKINYEIYQINEGVEPIEN